MLLSTYKKIYTLFHEHKGYMSAAQLRLAGITSNQIRELVMSGELECFARGQYRHTDCGYPRPERYKYVEICKADPQAVICLDSAAYLHGIFREEPETVSFAVPRDDRRKYSFVYPVHRYFLQNTGVEQEIETQIYSGHEVLIYNKERTICDCLRISDAMNPAQKEELYAYCRTIAHSDRQMERLMTYATLLRAREPVSKKLSQTGVRENRILTDTPSV